MGEHDSDFGVMGEFGGEVGGAGLFDFILRGEQGWRCGFPSFGNDRAPVVDGARRICPESSSQKYVGEKSSPVTA